MTQAGQQGPRRVTAKLAGVAGDDTRQPLRYTIRGDVVQLVEGGVGDVPVLHGVERTLRLPMELPTEGAVAGADDDGPAGDDPAAPVTAEEVGGSVPPPG